MEATPETQKMETKEGSLGHVNIHIDTHSGVQLTFKAVNELHIAAQTFCKAKGMTVDNLIPLTLYLMVQIETSVQYTGDEKKNFVLMAINELASDLLKKTDGKTYEQEWFIIKHVLPITIDNFIQVDRNIQPIHVRNNLCLTVLWNTCIKWPYRLCCCTFCCKAHRKYGK